MSGRNMMVLNKAGIEKWAADGDRASPFYCWIPQALDLDLQCPLVAVGHTGTPSPKAPHERAAVKQTSG